MNALSLRARILAILGAGAAIAACSSNSEPPNPGTGGTDGSTGGTSAGGSPGCYMLGSQYCCRTTSCIPNALDAGPDASISELCAPSLTMCAEPLVGFDAGLCCYSIWTPPTCCGRPFFVRDELRRAPAVTRGDWIDRGDETAPELEPGARSALARGWLEEARLEHASIASFARFSLELLSLGAPADLVRDSHRAALEEVRHAVDCFGLASRYAGEELGPGRLDISASVESVSLSECAARAAIEGAVGETLSALVANARLAHAEDDRVRATLRRIVEDEARHAELAWRFLRWAVARGGERMRAELWRQFRRAQVGVEQSRPRCAPSAHFEDCHTHGLLTPEAEWSVRVAAMRDVVEPCAQVLLTRGVVDNTNDLRR